MKYGLRFSQNATWRLLRRHISSVIALIAFVGVPIAVLLLTGGLSTFGFWITALLMIPAVALGVAPMGFVLILVLAPILFVFEKLFPRRLDGIVENGSGVLSLCFGVAAYVLRADLRPSGVRLPFPYPWAGAGALLVISTALLTMWVLLRLSGKLEMGPMPLASYRGPSEPVEEFWDAEPAIGWRAWNWDGRRLRGVYATWSSELLVAKCKYEHQAPAWNHVCGIYAFKESSTAGMAISSPPVVGRVEMWGTVIEHEDGYRCSQARITDLWVIDEEIAKQVRRRYPRAEVRVGSPSMIRKD